MNYTLIMLMSALALSFAIVATMPVVHAAELNPAHDANNGNGNEKNFGQCKQEARNDQACIAKK